MFGEGGDDDEPLRANDRYRRTLEKVWKDPEFKATLALTRGSVGSHSVRKFASTWPAEHGIRQDDIEIRGRWKGGKNGRTVNKYINVEQLPTDGKVAACLCIGGPVKYKPKSGSGLTCEFLKTKACPGIFQHFAGDENNKIGCVLAMPLIWAAHTPGLEHLMSDEVRLRIKNACDQIRGDHAADWNPICKVPLVVTTVENRLVIDEMLIMGQPDSGWASRQI